MPTPDVVTGPPLIRLDAPALRMDDLTLAGAVICAPIRPVLRRVHPGSPAPRRKAV